MIILNDIEKKLIAKASQELLIDICLRNGMIVSENDILRITLDNYYYQTTITKPCISNQHDEIRYSISAAELPHIIKEIRKESIIDLLA